MNNHTLASGMLIYLSCYNANRRISVTDSITVNSSALYPLVHMYQPSLKPILGSMLQKARKKLQEKINLPLLYLEKDTSLYDQPSLEALIKKILTKGDAVYVKGRFNEFYYIVSDNKDGWIRKF